MTQDHRDVYDNQSKFHTKRTTGPLRCCDDATAPRVPMHTVSAQGRDDDKQVRWPTADGSAVDRNSVPASGVVSAASISNTALGPVQLTKESEAGIQEQPILGSDNFKAVPAMPISYFWHAHRRDFRNKSRSITSPQRHPSVDHEHPANPQFPYLVQLNMHNVGWRSVPS